MPRNILNIAAGYIPLVASDFDHWDVARLINVDPLDDSQTTVAFQALINAMDDVEYHTTAQAAVQAIGNDPIHLTMGVSPFGFALVDQWNDALMVVGSHVMAFGNSANPYIAKAGAFTPAVVNNYEEVEDGLADWLRGIALQVLQDYPSQRTALNGATPLRECNVFRKTA